MLPQSTLSVSKGCFVFKNATRPSNASTSSKPTAKTRRSAAAAAQNSTASLLGAAFTSQRWYGAYQRAWSHIRQQHERLQTVSYAHTLAYLRQFVAATQARQTRAQHAADDDFADADVDPNLPTTALLTGINQPDHVQLFRRFAHQVRSELRSHVCILQSMDCPNMKTTIEAMVSGLMEEHSEPSDTDAEDVDAVNGGGSGDDDDDEEVDAGEVRRLRRSQYTMAVLKAWYAHKYPADRQPQQQRPMLTVIVPDFENFQRDVLQQFILLLSHNCRRLPLVLVLGVATDLATLHRTLSFADTSRMSLQVSQSQPSAQCLSRILDEIVLTPDCGVTLSAKVYTLLTDIFLYYDLSIQSFMQGFKYCVMEHFAQGNAYALCTASSPSDVRTAVEALTDADLETIRRLPSFRRYVESLCQPRHVIAVLTDAEALRGQLPALLGDIGAWLQLWHGALRLLHALLAELPRTASALGRQLRDLYAPCASCAITEHRDFQAAWELLALMSRDELQAVLRRGADALAAYAERYCRRGARETAAQICEQIAAYAERIGAAAVQRQQHEKSPEELQSTSVPGKVLSRQEMQARVLQMSRQPKTISPFAAAVAEALDYLRNEVLAVHLRPFAVAPPLFELFRFGDVAAVRGHIMGAPRAALHTALNAPHAYLQCECCALDNAAQMRTTLPDLSIVYKLHLESGAMINLFDWMQAFRAVVEPDEEGRAEETGPIAPQLQARFTRAVAELQFLGFIKSSKRKADHVARLTW